MLGPLSRTQTKCKSCRHREKSENPLTVDGGGKSLINPADGESGKITFYEAIHFVGGDAEGKRLTCRRYFDLTMESEIIIEFSDYYVIIKFAMRCSR
jgi:hypothetical protein